MTSGHSGKIIRDNLHYLLITEYSWLHWTNLKMGKALAMSSSHSSKMNLIRRTKISLLKKKGHGYQLNFTTLIKSALQWQSHCKHNMQQVYSSSIYSESSSVSGVNGARELISVIAVSVQRPYCACALYCASVTSHWQHCTDTENSCSRPQPNTTFNTTGCKIFSLKCFFNFKS